MMYCTLSKRPPNGSHKWSSLAVYIKYEGLTNTLGGSWSIGNPLIVSQGKDTVSYTRKANPVSDPIFYTQALHASFSTTVAVLKWRLIADTSDWQKGQKFLTLGLRVRVTTEYRILSQGLFLAGPWVVLESHRELFECSYGGLLVRPNVVWVVPYRSSGGLAVTLSELNYCTFSPTSFSISFFLLHSCVDSQACAVLHLWSTP